MLKKDGFNFFIEDIANIHSLGNIHMNIIQ